jgi:hypothetical protein
VLCGLAFAASVRAQDAPTEPDSSLETITITAQRWDLLGSATTASEGVVDDQELQLSPQYRPGQLLETVPGLIVTLHSGEGKANQYLMRGYNLDHGTDLETYVDGMPINQPTHAHGQGYTDLNFVIPELADGLSYTKGPYYATVGDFGAVGSVRMSYRDTMPDQIAAGTGTLDFRRVLGAGSTAFGGGKLLAAVEGQYYDGPFLTPDDARKANAVLRYSQGDERNGGSITAMYYRQVWTSTTDIPIRAITDGVVPDRFGTLDPSDGGQAQRVSLSMNYHGTLDTGAWSASGFYIYNELRMFNNFTHYLIDPVHGDQEYQHENRHVAGGALSYVIPVPIGSIPNQIEVGGRVRYDWLGVGRSPSEGQVPFMAGDAPPSYYNDDQVYLFAGAAYLQAETHWTSRFRSVIGVRADHQHGTDVDYLAALHEAAGYTNGGTKSQTLLQPKASLIFTANPRLEFYVSGGEGFHSADLRGVNQVRSVDLGLPNTPLLAAQWGEEVGVRANPKRDLAVTLALYTLWQQSETTIDPDIGADVAGPPSRRSGYEINVTYQLSRWLEFYGSYSGDHTRFTHPFDDGTGHLGTYITAAPVATGMFALYLTHLGPWSAGLDFRYLGSYPLSSGPCVDAAARRDFPNVASSCLDAPTAPGQVNGKGFGEMNLDVHYAAASGWTASLGIYNLLNTHAPAAQFWYVDRLQSEIAAYPDGRADTHQHPLEPIMARISVTKTFGT